MNHWFIIHVGKAAPQPGAGVDRIRVSDLRLSSDKPCGAKKEACAITLLLWSQVN